MASATTNANPPVYRRDIDGLRAIAVVAVMLYHAFPAALPGGFVGVDIFFVISGYLISQIIEKELRAGRFSIAAFYERRVRRIFPALALVLAACLATGWFVLYAEEYRKLGKHVAAGAAFVSNLFFWRESDYFDPDATSKPLLHLWSLGVEEQFYLVWPLFFWWIHRRGVRPGRAIGAVIVVSLAACVATSAEHATAAFYAPWTRMWELGAGAWLADRSDRRSVVAPRHATADARAFAGVLLIVLGFGYIDETKVFPGLLALLPVAGTALLLSAGPDSWFNRRILSQRVLVAIGLISYPLYLWHWPLLSYMWIVDGDAPSAAMRWLALGAALILAFATFRLVERPVRRRADRPTAIALAVAVAALGVAGAIVYGRFGLIDRAVNAPFAAAGLADYYQSRESDESCPRLLGATLVPEEICLAGTAAPRALFVGDSHAMALFSGIHAGRFDEPAALVGGHSCALYPELFYAPTYRKGWGNNCTSIARQAIDLAGAKPSIRTVFLTAKAPDLDAATAAKSSPYARTPGGPRVAETTAFVDGTGQLIEGFLKAGKRVVLIVAVPEFPRPPTSCERRLPQFATPDCRIAVSTGDRSLYLGAVKTLQARYPALEVFDPVPAICPNGLCSAKRDSIYLYHDEQHLSIEGSLLLLNALREAALLP